MSGSDNKYNYWMFTIQAVKGSTLPGEQTVAKAIGRLTERYLFQLEKATSLHYQGCCKTRIRKRKNTVVNEFSVELDVPRSCIVIEPMQGTWEQAKLYCSKTETSISEPFTNDVTYSRDDISVLDEKDRRYPWQNSIISELIDEATNIIKDADDRTIIWIQDSKGGNGKSKLVKWCCCNYDDIVKISFGTSSQLRSAIVSAGQRKAYFIDVPRTLGSDDSMASLMSSLEDLKNGFVTTSFYGQHKQLLLDPPHIVVFSNGICPSRMMSKDRWKEYLITEDKELVSLGDTLHPWIIQK